MKNLKKNNHSDHGYHEEQVQVKLTWFTVLLLTIVLIGFVAMIVRQYQGY